MSKRILLADDSITIQKVVELTFSDGDYEVTAVNNGAKAIQKLGEMRPDIILSDIIMPEKNGYEVCEYVKSHPEHRNIPVILLTGTFEPFDPDRAEKAGCDAVVTKPFESQSLIHKVEELIEQSRSAPPAAAPAAPEPETRPPASPWMEEDSSAASPFTTSGGSQPMPAPESFTHDADIFSATAAPEPATEMPFEPAAPQSADAADSPFGEPPPPEQFSGETRAFPRLSPEAIQRMQASSAPVEGSSPWDEPADSPFEQETDLGGETRAFGKLTFEEMQQIATPKPPEPTPQPEPESPFGTLAPADELSSETRAFPQMSAEELQRLGVQPSPPSPARAPAPAPSPWDEPAEPAPTGGETQAIPKLSLEELQRGPEPEGQAIPWDEPEAEFSLDEQDIETSQVAGEAATSVPFVDESDMEPEVEPEIEEPQVEPPAEAHLEAPEPSRVWTDAQPSRVQTEPAAAPAEELSDEQVDRIARRVVELMSDDVVRKIAWEVIPDLAEMVVKERIRQLESEG